MSSTRRSTTGKFHQERFCSAPELESDVINGLPAAKRIALVKDKAIHEVLWFIQWRSVSAGGLQVLCNELATRFPERIGSPTIRKLRRTKREVLTDEEARRVREECGLWYRWDEDLDEDERKVEYYWDHTLHELSKLPQLLKGFCLDPKADISKGVWFFHDLVGALLELRKRSAAAAGSRMAETAVTRKIFETLDFWFAERPMILIEGVAGIGRTESARAWTDAHCGVVRFVEVPSSGDDRSFFTAIARVLGIARGMSMKSQQIKVRIEEMLASSDLLLAFDESQYLWGQYIRPRKTPDRLLWIKSIFDAGTPIALIAHTDFSKWQTHYVKQTLWTDEQFERRLNRRVVLAAEHTREDMLKIARAHFPQGGSRCWNLLAAYALGIEKKQASGIVEALRSARYRAKQSGRDLATFTDIEAALMHDHEFLNPPVGADLQSSDGIAASDDADQVGSRSKGKTLFPQEFTDVVSRAQITMVRDVK
jgi:AAA domain-containing protein